MSGMIAILLLLVLHNAYGMQNIMSAIIIIGGRVPTFVVGDLPNLANRSGCGESRYSFAALLKITTSTATTVGRNIKYASDSQCSDRLPLENP